MRLQPLRVMLSHSHKLPAPRVRANLSIPFNWCCNCWPPLENTFKVNFKVNTFLKHSSRNNISKQKPKLGICFSTDVTAKRKCTTNIPEQKKCRKVPWTRWIPVASYMYCGCARPGHNRVAAMTSDHPGSETCSVSDVAGHCLRWRSRTADDD